jgi:hypothetical protein
VPELKVSYDVLDKVSTQMTSAAGDFADDPLGSGSGAFGAADVEQAFAVVRTMQQQMSVWLSDTANTLSQYAHDTKSLFQDADRDLAAKAHK